MAICRRRTIILSVGFLCLNLVAIPSYAALDLFLKIDGIDGEAAHNDHIDEINILSLTNSISNDGPGGKSCWEGFKLTKGIDRASVQLEAATASARLIKEATFAAHRPEDDHADFFIIDMVDVTVKSYELFITEGTEDGGETIVIYPQSFTVRYFRRTEGYYVLAGEWSSTEAKAASACDGVILTGLMIFSDGFEISL